MGKSESNPLGITSPLLKQGRSVKFLKIVILLHDQEPQRAEGKTDSPFWDYAAKPQEISSH